MDVDVRWVCVGVRLEGYRQCDEYSCSVMEGMFGVRLS